MKIVDISGQWKVTMKDGSEYLAILPGTLDENKIGHRDTNPNQWKPAEVSEEDNKNNVLLYRQENIITRLTRAYSYEGAAIYSRELPWEEVPAGTRVFLEAERSRELTLRINGETMEPYCHGTVSSPYIFEVTGKLAKNNTIELVCDNSYPNWPRNAILYSSAATDETQTNWNGIIGYLQLRMEKEVFLSKVRVYPNNRKITVKVDIDATIPYEGVLQLNSDALEYSMERRISVEAGRHTIVLDEIPVSKDCRLWDDLEGNLYEVCVSGDGLDSKIVSFGIRHFGDNGSGRLALNGRAIFLRSETNCCVFPETGYMPLTAEEWANILITYQDYGVNCIRFHSHCPPDAAFVAADKLGMLMQPELSHWNPETAFEDEKSWNYYQLELEQILLSYANHPSFVMLTFGNELHAKELGHQRMNELLTLARSIDPTRMYANGSNVHYGACGADTGSDFYTSSDFYGMQIRGTSSQMKGYINESYPNTKTNYDNIMSEIRKEYTGPVFSFEVGQYEVLPDFDEIDEFKGVTLPNNLRFIKNQVIEKGFYSDWKKRVEASGELARIAYKEEIEAAVRTKELSGISLLGLQDFPGQGTSLVGMLNSHLHPKPYGFAQPEQFRRFFRDVLPLAGLEKYTFTNQEELAAVIEIANYGKRTITAPTVYELSDGEEVIAKGSLSTVTMPCGGITIIGKITISLKDILTARKLRLTVTIDEKKNDYPIWVYPDLPIDTFGEVIVTKTLADTQKELERGKRVLYSPVADHEHFPSSVQAQFTTDFWSVGTFASQSGCMGCLINSSHPLFLEFPTETHSNWQWWPMSKGRAIILSDEVEPIITVMDCYARLRKMAFLFECTVGNGKLMVSSMGLLEKQEYPEVRALTNSILHYMNSLEFAPKRKISLELLQSMIK